jgi:diguanylate cyclase (GGDEF)-like protein
MRGVNLGRLKAGMRRLIAWSEIGLVPSDMELARSMSALFWLLGGLITALLLPWAPPTAELGDAAGWTLAIAGVLVCFWIGYRHLDPGVTIGRIHLAGFIGIFLVAALEWIAGGRDTPYHYLYMLPVLFAAAAQRPRRALELVAVLSVIIWLPLLYEGTERRIVLDIATELITLLAIGSAVWGLFVILRVQRRTIREQRSTAEVLARQDELTGLGNRRALGEALRREVARARRGERQLSVVVGDLDHFKEVNDLRGHAAGDEYLRRAADSLRSIAREGDACFRWGGDEFAILLPETDRSQAEGVAQRLRETIDAVEPPPTGPRLSITCGVAELGGEIDPDALIARADHEMLAFKRAADPTS